ncbi:hypothetical protein [Streptomyces sp. MK5]|uniref:hypothetical protein n=1 Tax=Streptomyces sp. MK5 TaxID=3064253 RepID=UPI0027404F5C|nr:hypothetical protein [Streptomyces sp. MK5]
MLLAVIEHFQPVFFSKAVWSFVCRSDGLTRRTISRIPYVIARKYRTHRWCKAGRSGGGREGRRWAVDLDSVVEELYTLHPTQFVGARTARVEAALAAGQAALAAQSPH